MLLRKYEENGKKLLITKFTLIKQITKVQKNLIKSSFLAKKKAFEIQLLSSAKLVHTLCVPRAPVAVMRAAGVVRGRHQTKTNRATVELCSTEPIVAYS